MSFWCLRLALGIFALANFGLLATVVYDRLGPQQGRLVIEDCRLEIDPAADGLWAMITGRGRPVALDSASFYMPAGETRPAAARLADFGFSVDPEAPQSPAMTAYVAVESHGPAVEAYSEQLEPTAPRPVVVRDVAIDADRLAARYSGGDGIAIARGIADIVRTDSTVSLVPRLRVHRLQLDRNIRRRLEEALAEREGGPCRSRILVEIAYGATYSPRIVGLRPLEQVR